MRSNTLALLLIAYAAPAFTQTLTPSAGTPTPPPAPVNTPTAATQAPTKSPAPPTATAPAKAVPVAPTAVVQAAPAGLALVPAPKAGSRSSAATRDAEIDAEIDGMDKEIQLINKKIEKQNAEQSLLSRLGGTRAPTGIPSLIGITGTGKKLVAKFIYDGRTIVYARIGETLPSQYVLESINASFATLRKDNTRVDLSLTFNRDAATATTAQALPSSIPVDSAGPIIGRNPTPGR